MKINTHKGIIFKIKAVFLTNVRELRWNNKTIYDGDASKKLDEVIALMSKIIESK